ncbi:hypothetical protein J2S74_002020 [Evansella vedderi]|uniref:PrcB C-terminal domain-containing protein n=1 Tax=Evansella vedderi TaxID=38282 RepID=A0ABT9ZTR9_9BACI|nr:protease complex subunit PrcB family protein [Evansella vedderi]MDQ0254641.1 hypothetical protein [Evansella vedderi]
MSLGKKIIGTLVLMLIVTGCGTGGKMESNETEVDNSMLVKLLSEELKGDTKLKGDLNIDFLLKVQSHVEEESNRETNESEDKKKEEETDTSNNEVEVREAEIKEQKEDNEGKEEKEEEEGEDEEMRGKVDFRYVAGNELPDNVYEYYSSIQNKDIRDWRIFNNGQEDFIVISGGLKNTGGHSIEVLEVNNEEGITFIKVKEKSPGAGDIVTQAFMNPTVIIAVDKDRVTNVIEVVDEFGNPFQQHGESM